LVSTSVPSRHPGASLYCYVIPAGAPILVQPLTLLHGLIATTPLCLHCCRNTALPWFLHLDLSVANCSAVPVVCHESRRFTLLPRHLHAPLVCRQAPGCSPATLSSIASATLVSPFTGNRSQIPDSFAQRRCLGFLLHAPLVCRQAPGCSPATLSFSCFPSHLQSVCFHRAFARFSLFFASAPHSVDPYCPVLRLPGRHSFHIRVVAPVTPGFSILNPLLALLQHCRLLSGPSSSFKLLVTCNATCTQLPSPRPVSCLLSAPAS